MITLAHFGYIQYCSYTCLMLDLVLTSLLYSSYIVKTRERLDRNACAHSWGESVIGSEYIYILGTLYDCKSATSSPQTF